VKFGGQVSAYMVGGVCFEYDAFGRVVGFNVGFRRTGFVDSTRRWWCIPPLATGVDLQGLMLCSRIS
jgi:hypothetical protein